MSLKSASVQGLSYTALVQGLPKEVLIQGPRKVVMKKSSYQSSIGTRCFKSVWGVTNVLPEFIGVLLGCYQGVAGVLLR